MAVDEATVEVEVAISPSPTTTGEDTSKGDMKPEQKGEEKKSESKAAMAPPAAPKDKGRVPISQLYRYSTSADRALMVVGSIMAIAVGGSLPLVFLYFGDLLNIFINYNKVVGCAAFPPLPNATSAKSYIDTVVDSFDDLRIQALVGSNHLQLYDIAKHVYDGDSSGGSDPPFPTLTELQTASASNTLNPVLAAFASSQLSLSAVGGSIPLRYTSAFANTLWYGSCTLNNTGFLPDVAVSSYLSNIAPLPYSGGWNETWLSNSSLPSTPDKLLQQIQYYILLFVVAALVMFAAGYFRMSLWKIAGERQAMRIREAYFLSLLRQEIGWYDTAKVGELTSRISADTITIAEGMTDKMALLIEMLARFVISMILAYIRGWQLALVMMVVVPFIGASTYIFTKVFGTFAVKTFAAYATAGAIAQEVLSSVRTVASFSGQDKESKRYDSKLGAAEKAGIRMALASSTSAGIINFIAFVANSIAFFAGAYFVNSGVMGGGDVLGVCFTVIIGSFALGQAAPSITGIFESAAAAHRIFAVIDRKPEIDSLSTKGKKLGGVRGEVEFRNVYFCYPSRPSVTVLNGCSMCIPPAKTVALVGHSGSGKSTIMSMVQRFYDPLSGQVLLDEHDLTTLNPRWLRHQMGYVGQEPIMFPTSLRNNILLANEGASDDLIWKALKIANAAAFVKALPKGLDTLAGDKGVQLSGGQKQRIAIARAAIKNPSIMLLDEATSALDTESEKAVQGALNTVLAGRTSIIIAHRLSTIRHADIIFVMEAGKVLESGSHEQLLRVDGGRYRELIVTQTGMKVSEDDEEGKDKDGSEDVMEDECASPPWMGSPSRVVEVVEGVQYRDGKGQSKRKVKKGEEDDEVVVKLSDLAKLIKANLAFMITGILAATLDGLVMPLFSVVFGGVLNVFSLKGDELISQASYFSLLLFLLAFARGFLMFVQVFSFGYVGEKLTKRLRSLLLRSMLRQDMTWFDDEAHTSGKLVSQLAMDATMVRGMFGDRIAQIFRMIASLATGIVLAFVASWQLALVAFLIFPIIAIDTLLQNNNFIKNAKKKEDEFAAANQLASQSLDGIRTVAAFTAETQVFDEYAIMTEKILGREIKRSFLSGITYGLASGIIFFAYAIVFYAGAHFIVDGFLTFQQMLIVFFAILFAAQNFAQAIAWGPDVQKSRQAAARMFKTIKRKPIVVDVGNNDGHVHDIDVSKKPLHPALADGRSMEVALNNVTFTYPSRPTIQVLKGVSVHVQRGQKVAFVGSSGCGKSTIFSLIQRFYDVTGGSIEVNGINIKQLPLSDLRHCIGMVSQEPVLFSTTIAENIRYGKGDATTEEVEKAAKVANAHSFILEQTDGYNTEVGAGGGQLSGGQKQRIAIARAVVRSPELLLLDEATSALDSKSEAVVQDALERAMENRTSITIAHRLSTVKNADVIYVFQTGVIAEMGTHDELLQKENGIYRKLVNMQSTH
uniref:ATP-dependent transporter ycf16 n=1 Tax=Palpitomonas bilix TaxID=652834 RepID=A0A7S3GJN5_9EUKA|mmetsp:Transcript_6477/g.16078  ORF Transcript_6477/g.16078 Transcript_6477/m.16078 type:complete len:1458 (+) Transcript_6477:76-4449(+)